MDCSKILEMAYEDDSVIGGIQVWIHTLFCETCREKIELYKSARAVMRQDFFPASSGLENSIMEKINKQEEAVNANTGVFSTRGWVITGLIIIISFATAFFGMEFQSLASETGTSFMLPIGILFGTVLTAYCAFFIGSHLKELTERFGL